MPTRSAIMLVWLTIVVSLCALAGGWHGLVYGSVGMLAGYWVNWTADQYDG